MIHNIFFFLSIIHPPPKPPTKCTFIMQSMAERHQKSMESLKRFMEENAIIIVPVDFKKTEEAKIEIKKRGLEKNPRL